MKMQKTVKINFLKTKIIVKIEIIAIMQANIELLPIAYEIYNTV